MTAAGAYSDLRRLDRPIISTAEAAARLRTSTSNASHRLRGMEEAGLLRRVKHGLWTLDPALDPFAVPPFLTAPLPAYVSAFSAMSRHGMIDQIPRRITVASLDRARRITTSLGTYEIRHLAPELFDGFAGSEGSGYLATPEKALFDTAYLRAAGVRAGGGAVATLPELSLPEGFDRSRLDVWLERIAAKRLRTITSRGLEQALEHADGA